MQQCPTEPCLFRYLLDGDECFLIQYVDDSLIAGHPKTIEHLKQEIERVRLDNKELQTSLQQRQSIQNNSYKKGKQGESTFEALALERKGWHLENTSSKGHYPDFHFILQETDIGFEIKGHDSTAKSAVPSKEVIKLRRDLRENPEIDVGVFISLHAKVTGIEGISLEWTSTHQLILYIPTFFDYDTGTVFHFLELIFLTVKPYRFLLRKNENQAEVVTLREKVDRAITYANNSLLRITQSMNTFQLDVRAVQDRLDDMISHTRANMAAQKEELVALMSVLSGKDIPAEEEIAVKKTKRRKAKKQESIESS